MSNHRLRNGAKDSAEDHLRCPSAGSTESQGPILLVNVSSLKPLQIRPSFFRYCLQLWERRSFIWADARSKALKTTKDYQLWRLWLVLQPVLDVAFYGFLFGFLLRTSKGVENFPGFLILGVIFMRQIIAMTSTGNMLIKNSRGMIQTFQFPRASLIISQALRNMIDNVLPAVMAVLIALAFQFNTPMHWSIVLVVPLFVLLHLFGCGMMFFTARLTAEIADTRALINFFTQAWFFLSGVMFSVDRFVEHPVIHAIMSGNPGYIFLTAIRGSVLYGSPLSVSTWGTLLAWSLGTFFAGLLYFWQAEEKYVRLT